MDKFDRIQQLHRIFTAHRRPVPLRVIAERLECTERNARRIIETMQNLLDAPIEYSREDNGWHYVDTLDDRFELPGLWLTGEELQSLTLLLSVLENLGNGLLNSELAPVERQIHQLLEARGISVSAFTEHIRVLPLGNRQLPGKVFHTVSEALLRGGQVRIRYKVFPTRVGVFLPFFDIIQKSGSLPHASGGVSDTHPEPHCETKSSPREWGCFS